MSKLVLARELHDSLVAMSRASLPNEACGLVGGVATEHGWEARSVHPVKNSLASPTAFALDGAAMIDAETRIDDSGNEVIGVWHSHPTSAPVPSMVDLANAAVYDPNGVFLQLVVSMQGFAPVVRAYLYGDETTNESGDTNGQLLRKYWLVRFGS